MSFTIDRINLPKPWERPLLFALSDGRRVVTAEISPRAALEYREAGRIGGAAVALAFQRREDFLQAVESAVDMLAGPEQAAIDHIVLDWDDLYPPDPRYG